MASEPKKPIEKMLEASAQARREAFGSDPKMPNPMRAQLHDEIARLARAEPDEVRRSWLQMFWPRIAVAAAMATLLVLGPVLWWRGSQTANRGTMDVAGRDTATTNALKDAEMGERRTANEPSVADKTASAAAQPEDLLAKGPAATTAAAATPEVNLADNSRAKIEPATTPAEADSFDASNRLAAAAPAAAAPAPTEVTKGYMTKQEAHAAMADSKLAAAVPAKTAAQRPANEMALSGTGSSAALAPPRQFIQQQTGQAFRNNARANQVTNVLNSFQVQQEGSDIRVVDSDGSTYTGKLEPAAQFKDQLVAKAKRSYTSRGELNSKVNATPQSRFRATGYNVSLKKSLVFEGDYTGTTPERRDSKDSESSEKPEPARIIGTARLHGEPPVQVDATEVESVQERK